MRPVREIATTDVGFGSFRARLLVLFLGLFVVVLSATLALVNAANRANARRQIDEALELSSGVFHRLIGNRSERLIEAARLLSGDYAFKTAYGTGDRATIRSALQNHRARIGADVMLLASLDYRVLVDTQDPESSGGLLPLAERSRALLDEGTLELSAITFLRGRPHQVVLVPLMVPIPDAWICVGFRIDDAFVEEFRRLTLSDVSLLVEDGDGGWTELASTLEGKRRPALPSALSAAGAAHDESTTLDLAGEPFVSWVTSLGEADGRRLVAVLQRSLAATLAPHLRLRRVLILVFFGALLSCLLLGLRLADSVSRPVLEIAEAAGRVERGDYGVAVTAARGDEIGRLAGSFNHMVRGLAERDRVRDLLGKVVSPAVAHELLRDEVVLGGEEREVTILFSDVRDFTAQSEAVAPETLVARLNRFLSAMSGVIEAEKGVVDKYVGDAIMALFGAPLARQDDAARAVRAALGMSRALVGLNESFRAEGAPEFRIGIGINTAVVVAGNMGSRDRLNYTVVGDGVNVASRIEGLTKLYGLEVLVSGDTRRAAPGFLYREIDRVRVRGKRGAVTIFEPVGSPDEVDDAARARVEIMDAALSAYRRRDWGPARRAFTELRQGGDTVLADLYLERLDRLGANPPADDWDATFDHGNARL